MKFLITAIFIQNHYYGRVFSIIRDKTSRISSYAVHKLRMTAYQSRLLHIMLYEQTKWKLILKSRLLNFFNVIEKEAYYLKIAKLRFFGARLETYQRGCAWVFLVSSHKQESTNSSSQEAEIEISRHLFTRTALLQTAGVRRRYFSNVHQRKSSQRSLLTKRRVLSTSVLVRQ